MSYNEFRNRISPIMLLRMYAQSAPQDMAEPTQAKIDRLFQESSRFTDRSQYSYTIETAYLLAQLESDGHILGWCASRGTEQLDRSCVDFLVQRTNSGIVGLQITSTPDRGKQRRRKIRALYGNDPPIPVFQWVTEGGHMLSQEEAKPRMLNLIAIAGAIV